MNLNKNYEDFLATNDPLRLQPNTDGWLPLAQKIREKLDGKGYLLDNYLAFVFEGIAHTKAMDAADAGNDAATVHWNAIRFVMAGEGVRGRKNPLYPQVKEYIDAHPLSYQEELTRQHIYYVMLAAHVPTHQLSDYIYRARPPVAKMDIVRLRDLYRDIGTLLGDFDPLEQLGESIRASFQITDAAHVFMQSAAEVLLYSLTYRDNETSKQVFQLLMDHPPDAPPEAKTE
ncbi:MAG: hypothetical protein ACOX0U_03540 [Oscillospiraceae bacterium]